MLRTKRHTPMRVSEQRDWSDTPLATHCQRFVEWTVSVGLSPATASIREQALKRFDRWSVERGAIDVCDISLSLIEDYQHHLAMYRKVDGELLASTTRTARLDPVVAFCQWLARQKLLAVNLLCDLTIPRHPRRLPGRIPTVAEVEAMICAIDTRKPSGIRDRAILETFYCTAMRRSELTGLRIPDVACESRTAFIRKGKGGANRMVPLAPRTVNWLRRYLVEVRPHLAVESRDSTLFLTDYGEAFIKNRLGDLVRRYVRKSGFPARGACHLLRHACATHMLENGADIRFIQVLLGHADLSSTQIYTHVSMYKLGAVHAETHPVFRLI
jgi:integrase/recombinase XerD